MQFVILIALALAPIFGLAFYIYLKDKYEPEPLHKVAFAFVLGILSAFPAMGLEYIGEVVLGLGPSTDLLQTAIFAFVVVAFSEEISKFFFFKSFLFSKKELNEPLDGIVYMAMVGLGFAAIENVMYVISADTFKENVAIAITRSFTAVPAHATFGVLMGYYMGLAKFSERRLPLIARGILVAVLFHGTYDFFLFQENYTGLVFVSFMALVIAIRYSVQAIKIHQEVSPFKDEDQQGTA